MNRGGSKNNSNRFFARFLLSVLLIVSVLLPFHRAQAVVPVTDALQIAKNSIDWIVEWGKQAYKLVNEKLGSKILSTVVSTAMNRIAYDTATWLGSGSKGQKPMFITKGWGPYLRDVGDEAAGRAIEQIGKWDPNFTFDLCKPDLQLQLKIGLGLSADYDKNRKPKCTFSQLKKNWQKELNNPNFLNSFQDMFNPTSNDLGVALTLQTRMAENRDLSKKNAENQRMTNKGWLDITGIGDNILNIPGIGGQSAELIQKVQTAPILKNYKDEFTQAANIFLNQLAITLVNEKLKKLGQKQPSGGSRSSGLTSINGYNGSGGITETKNFLRKIIQPSFDVKGDYNILSELSVCPNPNKAGPTNCVIDDKFREGAQEKITVSKAIERGYLKGEGIFGYNSNGLEPSYAEGYPFRSIVILRKFRILPAGWELAAKYIKQNLNAIGGARNLADLVACFDPNDNYHGYNDDGSQRWCEGLVDPNWVLKAPLNYCRRQGAGPEIVSETVSGSGEDSQLQIARNDKYCADEQSCVKENSDGSCQIYGYCTEERRKWRFDSESCEPRHNTCQTFKAEGGNTVSYLENSLDYRNCTVGNAGCRAYCADYDYAAGKFACTDSSIGDKIYLDRGAESCDAKNEGCHEYVRTKTGLGANLLLNSSFEQDLSVGGWAGIAAGTSTTAFDGVSGLELRTGLSSKSAAVARPGYDIGGQNSDVYTLSFYSNGCAAGGNFRVDTNQPGATNIATGTGWQYNQSTFIVPSAISGNQINMEFNSAAAGCLIDAVKLERGYKATAYNNYENNPKIYEKTLPDYYGGLGGVCYDASGNLRTSAPAECLNFARSCTVNEVGCDLFTAAEDKMQIPAKVGSQNYCVPECVGFKSYLATETYFDSSRAENLIAKTAKSCSAAAVGCDEFTNLDKVAAGGESTEYYSYLRQCIKPDPARCNEFYTWEGSNETGFQLRVVSLDSIAAAGSPDPRVTDPTTDANNCNETIFNLLPTDPAYNPDCREFYNTSGVKSYHLNALTVSCDEDCHPYRRTEQNIDPSIGTAAACAAAGGTWGDSNGDGSDDCVVCKNGGTWSAEHNACIYNAIPGQGRTCQAAASGCREYTGSSGRNVRVVVNHDFEDGTRQGWSSTAPTASNLSNESIAVGGHSLQVVVAGGNGRTELNVANQLKTDTSYVLSFIAKSGGATQLDGWFENGTGSSTALGIISGLSGEWQLYELNLARLDHSVDPNERMVIRGNGGFYIDNIKLTEIVNRYYLIKNSWQTPAVCHADLAGNPSPNYMLGCEEYTDRDRQTHYLKSFAYLCSESAVGCEQMIDTKNSATPEASTFNPDNPTVPADEYLYMVFNKTKQCNQDDKGCERLGKPYNYDRAVLYSDAYLKNDPDKYGSSMCTADATGCGEYSTAAGLSYFKDPGDQVCEWRQAVGSQSWSWLKKKVKRCNASGNVCLEDRDCASGRTCQDETVDNACPTDISAGNPPKTFGAGGGAPVEQPIGVPTPTSPASDVWSGLCPAEKSGCTELIDPISNFSVNQFFNDDFSQDIDPSPGPDGWGSPPAQQTRIERNTLYRLGGKDGAGANNLTISCNGGLSTLDQATNQLLSSGRSVTLPLGGENSSLLFYSGGSTNCTTTLNTVNVGSTRVELRRAAIDYQLAAGLNKNECNGVVNFNDGCVLFNQRSQSGPGMAGLVYDADISSSTPAAGVPAGNNDSNLLLKVDPDRVCDKWLACRSKTVYINSSGKEESFCFDVGLCNSVDDKGNCDNFLVSPKENQTFTPSTKGRLSNLTGYSKPGMDWLDGSGTRVEGYYNFGKMRQIGEVASLPNNDFERSDARGFPQSWLSESAPWTANVFKAIDNPYETQKECLNTNCGTHVPSGRAFLRLGAGFTAASEELDAVGGFDYVVSAYLNTVNLAGGSARLQMQERSGSGAILSTNNALSLASGVGWGLKLAKIHLNNNTSKIKIILDTLPNAGASTTGRAYFDEIKIMPALESYDLTPANPLDDNYFYTSQSCRLYPNENSLACDYYDDSGVRQMGWPGYCLEYDRAPGNENACLLWWPADKVKGDGVVEGAGYQGRYPVYYCTESQPMRFLEYRHLVSLGEGGCGGDGCDDTYGNPPAGSGYSLAACSGCGGGCRWGGNKDLCYYVPDGLNSVQLDGTANAYGVSWSTDGWYQYNGSLTDLGRGYSINNTNPQASYLCNGATSCNYPNELIKSEFSPTFFTDAAGLASMMGIPETGVSNTNPPRYCTELVQTVTQAGQNKYWSARVYEGSSYAEQCYNNGNTSSLGRCLYSADYNPFGSIVYPEPAGNPYDWDSKAYAGIQPLYYELPDTAGGLEAPYQPRMGQLHRQSLSTPPADRELQRLFAKSYGTWRWATSSAYQSVEGHYADAAGVGPAWDVPNVLCNGTGVGSRPSDRPADYCAILPAINNVKIGNGTGNVTIAKNGFINLTFNSKLDSQQLPLTLYVVDWGDAESTIASGIEMNDRPYPDKPHSLYHLYSYWDLKAKAGSGLVPASACATPHECRVRPQIKIKDNWGWCNGDAARGDCSTYVNFGGEIIVREN